MKQFNILVDFDTPLVAAAASQQKNTINVKYLRTGKVKEWENRTAFKKWLKEHPRWALEDFSIEDNSCVVGSVNQAVESLLGKMNDLTELPFAKTTKFVLGGVHGNFRNDIARIQPYKGNRSPKPLLFEKIKQKLISRVPQHILQPQTNIESDDLLSIYLAEEKHLGEKSSRCISFIDKDLKTCTGWTTSFKDREFPIYIDELTAFKNLCYQSLLGDKIDNILGIPKQVESVQKRFGLRKGEGFGTVSATKCLLNAWGYDECVEVVTFVYQETFKDGLLLEDGTKLNWLEVLDENMKLLKMLDYIGQDYIFSKEFGIKY